jgi:hypothetical protein
VIADILADGGYWGKASDSGWVIERRKNKILAEAAILGTSGKERAHPWGTFLYRPPARFTVGTIVGASSI